MITNTYTKSFVALLVALLIMPAVSLTAEAQVKRMPINEEDKLQTACTGLATMRTNMLKRLDERASAVGGRQDGRETTLTTARTERMNSLAAKRTELSAARTTGYASLRARATTTEAKAGVEAFIISVEAAVKTRQTSIDAAIKNFEEGVASLRATIDATTTDLKGKVSAGMNETFAAAQAACDANKTPAEVGTILKAGMESLRTQHKSNPGQYSFKEAFETLRTTRISAEKAALEKFKDDFEAAKVTLKAAF